MREHGNEPSVTQPGNEASVTPSLKHGNEASDDEDMKYCTVTYM